MIKTIPLIGLILIATSSFAQKRYTLSGTIKDEATGELLIGATIKIKELPQYGKATNSYGFFSLSAPDGEYTLVFSYIGYETISQQAMFSPCENGACRDTRTRIFITLFRIS